MPDIKQTEKLPTQFCSLSRMIVGKLFSLLPEVKKSAEVNCGEEMERREKKILFEQVTRCDVLLFLQ